MNNQFLSNVRRAAEIAKPDFLEFDDVESAIYEGVSSFRSFFDTKEERGAFVAWCKESEPTVYALAYDIAMQYHDQDDIEELSEHALYFLVRETMYNLLDKEM